MIDYLILGIIAIYIASTIVCLITVFISNYMYKQSVADNIRGIINSFMPILNTAVIVRNLK